jgi:putative oxidoreductase
MIIRNNFALPSLFLRLTLGISYLWFVADRLGFLGVNGSAHVGWGDWHHFILYASQVMSFLPPGDIPFFAILATAGELSFGFLLVIGCFTRMAALGSGLLSLMFAISMAISFGIESPLGYSVFTVSAASFLLATIPSYRWSVDEWRSKKK